MRYLSNIRFLCFNLGHDLTHFQLYSSNISTLSKPPKRTRDNLVRNATETNSIASLFNEITGILGTDFHITNETPGVSSFSETQVGPAVKREERYSCTESICENDEANINHANARNTNLVDTKLENVGGNDVSSIVRKITEIIRSEKGLSSIEEQLEKARFQFDSEIVEKVLKRCFKVPHLALRFFNWLQVTNGFSHTTETYNVILYIAGEAREFDLVENLLKGMETHSCKKDIKTWTILVSHYGRAKLVGQALLAFEEMKKTGLEPDLAAYRVMIRSLCLAKRAEIAVELYKEVISKDMTLDLNLHKLLLNCLAGSGDIVSVHLVADNMIKFSQIPVEKVYAFVLKSLCISRRIREALEFIRDLKRRNLTYDLEIFETLVKGLCKADRISDALEIVDIMGRKHMVDGRVYGFIINRYLKRNDFFKAFDLFQTIKDLGYMPPTSTYTDLIQYLFKTNRCQKACDLYNEMLERGVELDSVIITAMVAGHVRQNHISEAWKSFNSMEQRGISPTRKSYLIFIKELCKISNTDEIFKVLNKMQASNITVGDELTHLVICYLERKGDTDKLEFMKQIERNLKGYHQEREALSNIGTEPEDLNLNIESNPSEQVSKTYNEKDLEEVCRILSSSKQWCLIQESLEESNIKFTPAFVVEILHNCHLNGHIALSFFSWVGKQEGYSHTTETYNMGMKISGRGKDFKHMRNLFYEMRRKGCLITSDTWTIMITQYGRAGLTEISLKKFGEMRASQCKPNGSTYKYLILFLCGKRGRKVDEAIESFNEMIHMGFIPDKELIETYLDCLCEVGKLLDARKCIENLQKAGFYTSPLNYSLFIRSLLRKGRLEEALTVLDEIGAEKSTLDKYICGSLVHGLLQRGRLEEALTKVESMKKLDIFPTIHVYTSLIIYFFKEKQIGKALEIFEKMRKEGCEPTIVTYCAMIRGYMNMGKVVDAWNIFYQLRLKGPFPDFRTYSMFITSLCRVDKSEEALHLINEMLENGIAPSSVNFRTVFYGLNREGKQTLARTVLQKKSSLTRQRKFLT